jgi:hypothetical protein
MIYLEELEPGNFFTKDNKEEILLKTSDFRNSKPVKYYCVSILRGIGSWLEGSTPIVFTDLYKRDNDGNILPLKEYRDPKEISRQS